MAEDVFKEDDSVRIDRKSERTLIGCVIGSPLDLFSVYSVLVCPLSHLSLIRSLC